jgi:MFS family permease
LIVLVDVLGLTIVLPILPLYSERFGATPFVATLLSASYAACSLFSAPAIGRLSDRYGRRRLLLLSQAGTFVGFVILSQANALWLIFVGRILDGITAGNLSLAQAYISDHTAPENRAKSFGIIGIAFGIGFFIGPAVSGQLSHFGLHAPFILASALSATSIACTYFLLPKNELPPTRAPDAAGPPPPAGSRLSVFDWRVYAEYLKRPGVGALMVQFFLFQFAFSCFTQNFAMFAERRFFLASGKAWGGPEVGWIFAYSGFLGIMLQGGLIGRLVKRFGEPRLIIAGFLSVAVGYVFLGLAYTTVALLVAATFASFGNGVLRPVITSRITQAVGRHEQGAALGVSQGLAAIAMTLSPPAGGGLLTYAHLLLWALLCAGVSAAGFVLALSSRSPATTPPAAATTA